MQKRSIKNNQNVEQNIVIMLCCLSYCCFMLFAVLTIIRIRVVISIVPYLPDKSGHTMLY